LNQQISDLTKKKEQAAKNDQFQDALLSKIRIGFLEQEVAEFEKRLAFILS